MKENPLLFPLKWREKTDMDIESLKENLIKRFTGYKARLEDSEIYSRLLEFYQNLSPNVQKFISYGFLFLMVYMIYSLPASYVSDSSEKLTFFEENRKLTRDMIRASHIAKNTPSPPSSLSTSQLKSEVENKIKIQQVITEQQKGISTLPRVSDPSLLPKKVRQTGLKINIDKLTLKQSIQLGEALDSIKSSRLMNIIIQADKEDPHYFNVEYEVAGFSIPELRTRDQNKRDRKDRGDRRNRKDKKDGKNEKNRLKRKKQ